MLRTMALIATIALGALARAAEPKPADDFDWLLNQATTAPATRPSAPATRPAGFAPRKNPEARQGKIHLSSGKVVAGPLATTREKPLRVWDDKDKEYRDIPLALIQSMEAKILWEREEKEWHFKETGSDLKEYSGKTYPARELQYVVKLINGQTLTGGIVAPLYLGDQDPQLYVLNKRQKGELGQRLKDLVYIKRVELE